MRTRAGRRPSLGSETKFFQCSQRKEPVGSARRSALARNIQVTGVCNLRYTEGRDPFTLVTLSHLRTMDTSHDPKLPARLGRYAVVRRLGAGGMAEVFLARSRGAEGTDKLLVVKRILPAFAANARFRAMFVDEARVALRLNHPNIVQVYGFESDGPTLLLVMEYIDGPDLAALAHAVHTRGEKIPPGLAAWIVREVARGLHYAHERKDEDGSPLEIVHRDVSPGNILLSHDGAVKLGDFGIAKARLVSGEDEGAIKGKFAYMSPEQARSESVDRRADLYSLGIVLGELLAGRPLFDRESVSGADLLARLRRGETPDIRSIVRDAPEELLDIVARSIAADRNQRFATARDMGLALTRFLRSLDEEWDASALEQYIARFFSRTPVQAPETLVADEFPRGPGPDASTVPQVPAHPRPSMQTVQSLGHDSRPPTALDGSALMRERVHVAVIVGRIVAPATTEDTVDARPLHELFASLAFKADATLERTDEGRFTVVVGVVNPHVDHPLQAARLALDFVEAAQTLASEQGNEGSLCVAIGMARGIAAAARDSDGTLLGFELVDEAIPFALALSDLAEPGEILVTAGLYRLVRRAFVLSEHHTRIGIGPRTFRLLRMKTRAEREQDVGASHIALVGREQELSRLREAMARVRDTRQGAAILVVGEVGIGKSALVAAFAAECENRAIRVPVPFGSADRPYRTVAHLLGELLSIPEEQSDNRSVLETAIDRAITMAQIPSLAGQRAARRALRVAMGLDHDEAGNETATVREITLVLRRLLAARAVPNSLAVILDGVDQADRDSRAVLMDLVHKPPPEGVLVVPVLRDTDPWVREVHHLPTVTVGPLPEEARGTLLATRLGATDVSPDVLREVSAVSGGNPLMILEVVEALVDRGRIEVVADEQGSRVTLVPAREGEVPLPATLEEVLAARIDALPPEARALVRWCALIDAELPVDLLEALAGDDAPRAVGRLLSDGILIHAQRDVLTFAHSALAKVARASIDPTLVAGMHARIAALLERRAASRGIGALMLARHREAAGALRPAARAYLEYAGALRLMSRNREALEAYARVLQLTHDTSDPEGYALRFAAHLGREEIVRSAGMTRARRAEILAMRAIAVDAKDPRLIARALARQARYKLETSLGTGIERDVAAATHAARRAGEPRTEAEAKRVLAVYLGQKGRYSEALRATDEALTALESRGAVAPPPGGSTEDGVRAARTVRIGVLIAKGALLRQTGEITRAIEVYAEAYALLARHGPKRLLSHVLNNLGVACSARGDHRDALRLFLAAIAAQRDNGQRDRLVVALSNAGQTYAALGDTERALAFLRKAVEVNAALGGRGSGSADAHVALAEIHCARGETELALAELERARLDAEASGSRYDAVRVKLGEAIVANARGEFHTARTSAEEAQRIAAEAGLVVFVLHARAQAAEAAAGMGDALAAEKYLNAVLSDPAFAEPLRLERGDLVIDACERAFRKLGEHARADWVSRLRGALKQTDRSGGMEART